MWKFDLNVNVYFFTIMKRFNPAKVGCVSLSRPSSISIFSKLRNSLVGCALIISEGGLIIFSSPFSRYAIEERRALSA
jgi:hypothetical protein